MTISPQTNTLESSNQQQPQMQKIYLHLDCETRGPKAGHDQLVQLSLLAVLAESDVCPDSETPFHPNICPCFVNQRTWSFHSDEIRWDEKTRCFWNEHSYVYRKITENCLPAQVVVQQMSDFLKELDKSYIIKGIVMSPSWFDWSHFVHCYNLFSESIVNRYDPGKLNVICLKTYIHIANHLGLPVLYHPNLKHTHNSADDVKVAAYKFYWLERSISIARNHLKKHTARKQQKGIHNPSSTIPSHSSTRTFNSYSDFIKFLLKNKGEETTRWRTPKTKYCKRNFTNQRPHIKMNDFLNPNHTFTWQQRSYLLKKR